MSSKENEVKRLFDRALKIEPPEERRKWLEQRFADRPELLRQVEQLLQAETTARSYSQSRTAPPVALVPETLSLPQRYQPIAEIARGGMGAVWRVVDQQFQRALAVKVMLSERAADAEVRARFDREAQLTGSLQHPTIPPVVDRGLLDDGTPFFSMKLVEGQTLAELLETRASPTVDLPKYLGIFEQVCHAVGYAHSLNVIHRDLKPANVMVGAFGEVQLMDWGMAKQIDSTVESLARSPGSRASAASDQIAETVQFSGDNTTDTDDVMTQAGTVMGTLAYMAPEQGRGEIASLDARSDVFGLGAILYEILTGQRPFIGENVWQQVFNAELQPAFDRLETRQP